MDWYRSLDNKDKLGLILGLVISLVIILITRNI